MPDFKALVNQLLDAQDELVALEESRSSFLSIDVSPSPSIRELAVLETKIGSALPSEFRSYLEQVNGGHQVSSLFGRLYSCAEVRLFAQDNLDWIDAYQRPGGEAPDYPDLTVEQHKALVGNDRSEQFRMAYMPFLIEISQPNDGAVYLLNPQVSYSPGTWEVWSFANWYPGAHRGRSLQDLILDEICRIHKQVRSLKLPFDRKQAIDYAEKWVRQIMADEFCEPGVACTRLLMRMREDPLIEAWTAREGTGSLVNCVMIRITGRAP